MDFNTLKVETPLFSAAPHPRPGLTLSADKIHISENVYIADILVAAIEVPGYFILPLVIGTQRLCLQHFLYFTAPHCSETVVQCSAVQCSAVQYIAVQCGAVKRTALHCTPLQFTVVH